jgi:cysteine desulfurase/selenocysteine lyase
LSWKDLFPIEERLTYLNTASIGLMPIETFEVMKDIVKKKATNGYYQKTLEQLRDDWTDWTNQGAKLLDAKSEEIAFTFNTASGINYVLSGLTWNKGDAIVVNDQEFPTNRFPYEALAAKKELEIRTIHPQDTRVTLDLIKTQLDEKVKLLAISYIQYGTGYRADIKEIVEAVHDIGGYVLLDAIQGLGAMNFSVKDTNVDFIASGGYKWLIGPYNTGIFYCKEELLEKLQTAAIGWLSDTEFLGMDYHKFTYAKDARRFQQSMMPTFGGLVKSMEIINNIGLEKIEKHIFNVTAYLINQLRSLEPRVSIYSSCKPDERSGIVVFEIKDAEKLIEQLFKEKIVVSLRNGRIRVSIHLYNDKEDVDKLINQIHKFIK